MDDSEITDKIERLNATMIDGRPVAMGAAFYKACSDRGLISTDVKPFGANPTYKGLVPINLPDGMDEWEFQIGPPHA